MDEIQKRIDELHDKVKVLLKENYSVDSIMQELNKEGITKEYILTIIENINDEKEDRISYRNSMIMGIFFTLSGIALNVLSYRISAVHGLHLMIIFWGIIALGITTIIRGIVIYKR